MKTTLLLFACLIYTSHSLALEFSSQVNASQIIELYTSEGCSSCPPADRWLSQLRHDPRLFNQLIPLAFHVDYWNDIGWEDPFAHKDFTARQRTLKRQGILTSVYTPAFVANSSEWRGWFANRNHMPPVPLSQPGQLAGTIHNATLQVTFLSTQPCVLNVAYLGMGLTSRVTAGENKHRTLHHDFVVLTHWQVGTGTSQDGKTHWQTALPPLVDKGQQQSAIVVWLSEERSLKTLQATGSFLDPQTVEAISF